MPYCLFDSAIGWCGLAWNEGGLVRLQLPDADRAATARHLRRRARAEEEADPSPTVAQTIADLRRYFAGEPIEFSSVPVDMSQRGVNEQAIYAALRDVGWGRTTTYGALAQAAGLSGAAREVGLAMARNPVPVVIPCHRVLAAGQKIGGFSAPGGTVTKERLLALEGVRLDGDAPRLPGL